ncbi:hypothetical protein B0A50_02745 [Salinomyces thailandicus]|uniref:Uncharacterized protein n=1 Tax=Salinomyces thailandicus TaxID=706561 RepID=A0A4U0U6F3_9PEZI|nr:hypothetical protein B0A50_02745 [Salinomyces thailandica]
MMSSDVSNFETRMVAELELYWLIHKHSMAKVINLPHAQSALHAWKQEWESLFEQPRHQFLQMGYAFGQLLMYEQSLSNKSAAVREALLSEMLRLSTDIMRLATDTTDDRTQFLSDNVFHLATFAAVTACRLLSRYQEELRADSHLAGTDAVIANTIQWLDSIGLPSHIGHIMANVIRTVQRRLRSEASTLAPSTQKTSDGFGIPELLSADFIDFDWDAIMPD